MHFNSDNYVSIQLIVLKSMMLIFLMQGQHTVLANSVNYTTSTAVLLKATTVELAATNI